MLSAGDGLYFSREERCKLFGLDCAEDGLIWEGNEWSPGGEFVRRIRITNVTTSTIHFTYRMPKAKVFFLKFPEEVVLSAGNSFSLELRFRPVAQVAIDDSVEIVAAAGTFSLPVCARLPRLSLTVTSELHLGAVPVNEDTTGVVLIRNTGQVDAPFEWQCPAPFTISPATGVVPAGGSQEVAVTVRPTSAAVLRGAAVVTFGQHQQAGGGGPLPPHLQQQAHVHAVELHAVSKYQQLAVDSTRIDFGGVLLGSAAPLSMGDPRERRLTVRNVGPVRASAVIEMLEPSPARQFYVSPSRALLQPGEALQLAVRYAPHGAGVAACEHFRLLCPSALPIALTASARASGPVVTLARKERAGAPPPKRPLSLQFGDLRIGQQMACVVVLTNHSRAPAHFQVLADPDGVFGLAPARGVIGPQLSRQVVLRFAPLHPGNYYRRLRVLVAEGDCRFVDVMGTAYDDKRRPFPLRQRHVDAFRCRRPALQLAAPEAFLAHLERGGSAVCAAQAEREAEFCLAASPTPSGERQRDSAAAYSELFGLAPPPPPPGSLPAGSAAAAETSEAEASPPTAACAAGVPLRPAVTCSQELLDFGATSRLRPPPRQTVSLTNHSGTKVTVQWITPVSAVTGAAPAGAPSDAVAASEGVAAAAAAAAAEEQAAAAAEAAGLSSDPAVMRRLREGVRDWGVTPETADIEAGGSAEFRVSFRPSADASLYCQQLEAHVAPKVNRSFRLVDEAALTPPLCVPLTVMGHTFREGETPAPKLSTSFGGAAPEQTLRLPPTIVGSASYVTVALHNDTDIPAAYEWERQALGPVAAAAAGMAGGGGADGEGAASDAADAGSSPSSSPLLQLHPAKGIVPAGSFALVALRFAPDAPRRFHLPMRLRVNGSEREGLRVHVMAEGAMPRVSLPDGPVVYVRPTGVGSSSQRSYRLRNASPAPLRFAWEVPASLAGEVRVLPPSGEVPGNDEATVTVVFAPRRLGAVRGGLRCTVTCLEGSTTPALTLIAQGQASACNVAQVEAAAAQRAQEVAEEQGLAAAAGGDAAAGGGDYPLLAAGAAALVARTAPPATPAAVASVPPKRAPAQAGAGARDRVLQRLEVGFAGEATAGALSFASPSLDLGPAPLQRSVHATVLVTNATDGALPFRLDALLQLQLSRLAPGWQGLWRTLCNVPADGEGDPRWAEALAAAAAAPHSGAAAAGDSYTRTLALSLGAPGALRAVQQQQLLHAAAVAAGAAAGPLEAADAAAGSSTQEDESAEGRSRPVLSIEPREGVLPPRSTLPVILRFSPALPGVYRARLFCEMQRGAAGEGGPAQGGGGLTLTALPPGFEGDALSVREAMEAAAAAQLDSRDPATVDWDAEPRNASRAWCDVVGEGVVPSLLVEDARQLASREAMLLLFPRHLAGPHNSFAPPAAGDRALALMHGTAAAAGIDKDPLHALDSTSLPSVAGLGAGLGGLGGGSVLGAGFGHGASLLAEGSGAELRLMPLPDASVAGAGGARTGAAGAGGGGSVGGRAPKPALVPRDLWVRAGGFAAEALRGGVALPEEVGWGGWSFSPGSGAGAVPAAWLGLEPAEQGEGEAAAAASAQVAPAVRSVLRAHGRHPATMTTPAQLWRHLSLGELNAALAAPCPTPAELRYEGSGGGFGGAAQGSSVPEPTDADAIAAFIAPPLRSPQRHGPAASGSAAPPSAAASSALPRFVWEFPPAPLGTPPTVLLLRLRNPTRLPLEASFSFEGEADGVGAPEQEGWEALPEPASDAAGRTELVQRRIFGVSPRRLRLAPGQAGSVRVHYAYAALLGGGRHRVDLLMRAQEGGRSVVLELRGVTLPRAAAFLQVPWRGGVVDLASVRLGCRKPPLQRIPLANPTSAPVAWALDPASLEALERVREHGSAPFRLLQGSGVIPPGEVAQLTLLFAPLEAKAYELVLRLQYDVAPSPYPSPPGAAAGEGGHGPHRLGGHGARTAGAGVLTVVLRGRGFVPPPALPGLAGADSAGLLAPLPSELPLLPGVTVPPRGGPLAAGAGTAPFGDSPVGGGSLLLGGPSASLAFSPFSGSPSAASLSAASVADRALRGSGDGSDSAGDATLRTAAAAAEWSSGDPSRAALAASLFTLAGLDAVTAAVSTYFNPLDVASALLLQQGGPAGERSEATGASHMLLSQRGRGAPGADNAPPRQTEDARGAGPGSAAVFSGNDADNAAAALGQLLALAQVCAALPAAQPADKQAGPENIAPAGLAAASGDSTVPLPRHASGAPSAASALLDRSAPRIREAMLAKQSRAEGGSSAAPVATADGLGSRAQPRHSTVVANPTLLAAGPAEVAKAHWRGLLALVRRLLHPTVYASVFRRPETEPPLFPGAAPPLFSSLPPLHADLPEGMASLSCEDLRFGEVPCEGATHRLLVLRNRRRAQQKGQQGQGQAEQQTETGWLEFAWDAAHPLVASGALALHPMQGTVGPGEAVVIRVTLTAPGDPVVLAEDVHCAVSVPRTEYVARARAGLNALLRYRARWRATRHLIKPGSDTPHASVADRLTVSRALHLQEGAQASTLRAMRMSKWLPGNAASNRRIPGPTLQRVGAATRAAVLSTAGSAIAVGAAAAAGPAVLGLTGGGVPASARLITHIPYTVEAGPSAFASATAGPSDEEGPASAAGGAGRGARGKAGVWFKGDALQGHGSGGRAADPVRILAALLSGDMRVDEAPILRDEGAADMAGAAGGTGAARRALGATASPPRVPLLGTGGFGGGDELGALQRRQHDDASPPHQGAAGPGSQLALRLGGGGGPAGAAASAAGYDLGRVEADMRAVLLPPAPAALLTLHVAATALEASEYGETYGAPRLAAFLMQPPQPLRPAAGDAGALAQPAPAVVPLAAETAAGVSHAAAAVHAADAAAESAALLAANPAGAIKDVLAGLLAEVVADPEVAAAIRGASAAAAARGRDIVPQVAAPGAAGETAAAAGFSRPITGAPSVAVPASALQASAGGPASAAGAPASLLGEVRRAVQGFTFAEVAAGGAGLAGDASGALLPYPQLLALAAAPSPAASSGAGSTSAGAGLSGALSLLGLGRPILDAAVPPPRPGSEDLSLSAPGAGGAARSLRDDPGCRAFVCRVVESTLLQLARELLADEEVEFAPPAAAAAAASGVRAGAEAGSGRRAAGEWDRYPSGVDEEGEDALLRAQEGDSEGEDEDDVDADALQRMVDGGGYPTGGGLGDKAPSFGNVRRAAPQYRAGADDEEY